MITPISTLMYWFSNFKKPTQEQFYAWFRSFWHKDENIPMNKVEGLSTALEGTASAEQLRNHLTDSQAHSELFDHKVDKEAGKTLTSNDYTNDEKSTNWANAQKRVVGLTVTGDVDKIITLTFADGTAIQAPFTDKDTLPENLADIKLNSLNFNEQTGVLTGVRSDGLQLTVSLDGRYALLGHTHDDRYSQLGHTHSEYAPHAHRHNWDDIDGKPAIVTEEKIQEAIGKIQVGGRNLMRFTQNMSGSWFQREYWTPISETYNELSIYRSNSDWYGITQRIQLQEGEIYTLSLYVRKQGDLTFYMFAGDPRKGGSAQTEIIRTNGEIVNSGAQNTWYRVYVAFRVTQSGYCFARPEKSGTGYIDVCGFKLERGNIPTDWSPAHEDLLVSNNARASSSITLTHAHNNATIFLENITGVDLSGLEDLDSVSFRKCFAIGHVNFTTTNGKQIIYTGDSHNMQEGGDGSTAVVSVYGNKIYVDIRNV